MGETRKDAARGRLRTWSALGELGRTPTEYEIVTHAMNHTTTRPLPLEMGPDTPLPELLNALKGDTLATGEMMATYEAPEPQ